MSWKGRIIGLIIGFFFSPLGMIIGFILGYLWDKRQYEISLAKYRHAQTNEMFSKVLPSTFALMGYVSRGAGRINEMHIHQAENVMNQMNLSDAQREIMIEYFNIGKSDNFNVLAELERIKIDCNGNFQVYNYILEIVILMAIVDGNLDPGENERLHIIGNAFGINANTMEMLIQIRFAQYNFQNFARNYSQNRQDSGAYSGSQSNSNYNQSSNSQNSWNSGNSSSSNNSKSYHSSSSDLDNAYTILGVKKGDSWDDVRRAYKKLMLKYHPDRLAAQQLPPEMVQIYTEKAKDIQTAFDLIKRHLGKK